MRKVVVFTSSHISWSLIAYLVEKQCLEGVIITPTNHPQFHQMLEFLQQNNINVYQQPDVVKDDFLKFLEDIDADMAFSFSYEKIFSNKMISAFCEGIYNIHPSALPKYRGPNPLYWQIRKGEKSSAVSIHRVTEKIDEGDIYGTVDFVIEKEDTLGALGNKISSMIPELVDKFLNDYKSKSFHPIKQTNSLYYKNPTEEDFVIDWKNDTPFDISQKAKASNPLYGGVGAIIKDKPIKILEATPVVNQTYGVKEGMVILIDKNEGLIVCAKDGAIKLDVISSFEGIFSGYAYANFTKLFSGEEFKR